MDTKMYKYLSGCISLPQLVCLSLPMTSVLVSVLCFTAAFLSLCLSVQGWGEKYAQECCLGTQEMTGLECGHKFCAKCWADYLTSKIIDEGMGQTISCAAFGCDILVDDTTVM